MDASECKAARLFRLEYVSYGFVAHATSTNLCVVNFNSSLFSSDKMTARAPHRLAHAFSKSPFAWPSTMDAHKPTNAICASEEEHAIVAHAKLEFISGIPKPSPPSASLAHSSAESASSLIFTSWGGSPGARMISFSNARPRKQASKQSEAVVVRKRNAGFSAINFASPPTIFSRNDRLPMMFVFFLFVVTIARQSSKARRRRSACPLDSSKSAFSIKFDIVWPASIPFDSSEFMATTRASLTRNLRSSASSASVGDELSSLFFSSLLLNTISSFDAVVATQNKASKTSAYAFFAFASSTFENSGNWRNAEAHAMDNTTPSWSFVLHVNERSPETSVSRRISRNSLPNISSTELFDEDDDEEDRSAASSAPPIVGVIRTIAIERQCGMELFFASSSSSRMAPNNFFSFSLAATFAAATFAAAAAPRHRPATAAATLAVVSISSLLECSWCCVLLHPPPQHPSPSFSFSPSTSIAFCSVSLSPPHSIAVGASLLRSFLCALYALNACSHAFIL